MDTYWPVRNRQRDFLMGGEVICVIPEDSTDVLRRWWYPVHKDTYDIKQDKTRQLGKKFFFGGSGGGTGSARAPRCAQKKGGGGPLT
jgi:hypothetical protein